MEKQEGRKFDAEETANEGYLMRKKQLIKDWKKEYGINLF